MMVDFVNLTLPGLGSTERLASRWVCKAPSQKDELEEEEAMSRFY